jgi:Flp pilus assembly protein CpaB
MTYRLRNLILAVALALFAALATAMYVTSYEHRVESRQERVDVFVAKADVSPGTPASGVVLEKVKLNRGSVPPTPLTSLDQLRGQVATQWTYAGEPITLRRFAPPDQAGVRIDLKRELRAVQVVGERQQLLAGTLKPGDHVDLVANLKVNPNADVYVARVVLRDLRVLKTEGGGTDEKLTSPNGNLGVTLAMTDAQVPKFLFATSKHIWTLQLRPATDSVDSAEALTTMQKVLKAGIRGNTP